MARNKHPENTIKKILEEAERLFTTNGYTDTSMQDIIDALSPHMTKGAIYHHFKSKKDIFYTLFEKRYDEVMTLLDEIYEDCELTSAEKLGKISNIVRAYGNEDPLYRFLNQMSVTSGKFDPDVTAFILRMTEEKAMPYVKKIIAEGIEDGSIHDCHPEDLSEIFVYVTTLLLSSRRFLVDEEAYLRKECLVDEMLSPYGIRLNASVN